VKKLSAILSLIYPKIKRRKLSKDDSFNPFKSSFLSSGNITMANIDGNGNLKLSLI
jgi:hypothetical protein